MNEETQRIIEERFNALPEGVQKVLEGQELVEKISAIAERNSLKDKTEDLVFQVSLVLMAFEPIGELSDKISDFLEIPKEQAIRVANDLMKEVFSLPGIAEEFEIAPAAKTENATSENREDILSEIENPVPANLPTGADQSQILSKLTNTIKPGPLNIPEKKTEQPKREQDSKPQVSVPKYHGTDPYREPFE